MFVKVFAFVLFVYVIHAMPLEGQDEDDQHDLLALNSAPEEDIQSSGTEDSSRSKRHYGKWDSWFSVLEETKKNIFVWFCQKFFDTWIRLSLVPSGTKLFDWSFY